MNKILLWLATIVDKAGEILKINSTSGSIAIAIGIVIVSALVCSFVFKKVKKALGKAMAIVLVVAILIGSGVLTLGQVRNFLESSGIVVTEGWSSASEEGGSAFLYWIQHLMNDTDSEVGGFDFSHEGGFLD